MAEWRVPAPVSAQPQCSDLDCFMPATVLINGVPFCTGDGRAANGGSL